MLNDHDWYIVTEKPLRLDDIVGQVSHPTCGAVNTFLGAVREFTGGQRTASLTYEAYVPMAVQELRRIGEELMREYPGVRVAIHHRIGHLEIGEAAVLAAVAAPHRKEAFEVCEMAMERVKLSVPIWKKDHGDHGDEWVETGGMGNG